MSPRTKAFLTLITYLGSFYLLLAVTDFHLSRPALFFTYLSTAVVFSVVQARRPGLSVAFSLNLPIVLISIVELSRQEAVAVGCAAALAQCLFDPHLRRRPSQVLFNVAALATIIASADFVLSSLLPGSFGSVTLRLYVVAGAFFVANTLPAAMVHRFASKERLGHVWRQSYFWSFPYYLVAGAVAGVMHAANEAFSLDALLLAAPVAYVVYRHYHLQEGHLEEQQKHAGEMAALHLRAIEGLALAVEAKDVANTRGHLRRVQVYCVELGKELGLSGPDLEALRAAALLHDIGKLAVPEHILTKPGKLTAEEFAKMKVHPVVGAEIVEQVQFPYPVAPIVRAHHERWDGSGYPYGLQGDAIPLGARILAAVDCLDALISDREYRPGVPLPEAIQYLRSEAGKSFDPDVVSALERRCVELDRKAKLRINGHTPLSTDAVISKGDSPAAGLDLFGGRPADAPLDFLGTIAAARREDQAVVDLAANLGTSLDLEETLSKAQKRLREMVPHHTMAVFIRRANTLVAKYASGVNERVLASLEVPVGAGLAGWVAENGKHVVNGNPAVDPGFYCEPGQNLQSALAIPLEGSNGNIGAMVLYHAAADGFTNDHLRILVSVMPRIGLAVDNALKYREAGERANMDPATGLPNLHLLKQSLNSELARSRRLRQPLAVLHCTVEDREGGTAVGEALLQEFAKAVRRDGREYDLIGRIGPRDLGLALPSMKPEFLNSKIARLRESAAAAGLADQNVPLLIGYAFYPDDGEGAEHLFSLASRRRAMVTAETSDLAAPLTSLSDALADERKIPTVH
jgi:putative nucleotidyltransferase with HDIG domain